MLSYAPEIFSALISSEEKECYHLIYSQFSSHYTLKYIV